MSVLTHETPRTSNQNSAKIPTQKSPKGFDKGFMLHQESAAEAPNAARRDIVVIAIRHRIETEKAMYPPPISMLREIFVQTGITYPQDQENVTEKLDSFTSLALVAKDLYDEQIADSDSPTGKNRAKYGEVLDLVEPLQTPFMAAMDRFNKDSWVQSNPATVKPHSTEAYAIASLLTLDANRITPGFLMEPIEEIHE